MVGAEQKGVERGPQGAEGQALKHRCGSRHEQTPINNTSPPGDETLGRAHGAMVGAGRRADKTCGCNTVVGARNNLRGLFAGGGVELHAQAFFFHGDARRLHAQALQAFALGRAQGVEHGVLQYFLQQRSPRAL